MKAEKVIVSFVAVLIGLLAAGGAFYLYQATKALPSSQTKPLTIAASPTPEPLSDKAHLFNIDSPKDEAVFNKKLITISGKTVSGAIVTVSTEDNDQVVKPSSNGDFTFTQSIPDGTTLMHFTAIYPDGTEKRITRTVTFSTENF